MMLVISNAGNIIPRGGLMAAIALSYVRGTATTSNALIFLARDPF
jgi:hypothetical protein